MKKIILFFTMFTLGLLLNAQSYESFLDYINTLPEADRQAKVDSFKTAETLFPITEDTLAHFIYIGSGSDLAVPGDFSGWDPALAPMTKLAGTNMWYRTYTFENDARLDYKFVYNGSTWILDPRNPNTAPGGFGNNSELRMPEYIPPAEILTYPDIPHGTFKDTSFYSTNLKNTRKVQVYLPPGYAGSSAEYPVVLVHDGLEYISFGKMNNVIDYLISENKIRPVIAVFVPPVDRSPEYIDQKQGVFTDFIIKELMPWLDARYRTITEPGSRAVLGSSAGGNISLWLGVTHPEIFGNVAAFSSYIESDILDTFATSARLDLRIYLIQGKYDHLDVIHQSVNNILPILGEKNYDYLYKEYPEGHSYGFWRAHTGDALELFFPGFPVSSNEEMELRAPVPGLKIYPNPAGNTLYFNHSAIIHRLEIFDLNGKLVKSVTGLYNSELDVSEIPDGIYLVRALENTGIQTSKFVKFNSSL